MNQQLHSQLDKILALADSAHDGEAVVAVRKARQVLSSNGLCFSDLARAAAHKPRTISLPFFTSSSAGLEIENNTLRQKLSTLEAALTMHAADTELWRRRATELEQKCATNQSEARRWRQLARDTVEKLWDLGQTMRDDDGAVVRGASKQA